MRTWDRIEIKKLEVFARHGVMPEENTLGQKFVISLCLYCDVRKAGQTDNLEDSVNYAQVAAFVRSLAEQNTFRLIERLAEYLAEQILQMYPFVQKTDVTVEKPWAPVHLPLETVSVSVSRQWHTVYLSIGSNLGDRKAHLDLAVQRLNEYDDTRVQKVSSYRETAPVGGVAQPDFLNAAVQLQTLLLPEEFLDRIGVLEQEQKRERTVRWGPRTIDLDILLYDDEIVQTERLRIPHVEMARRMFVLEPMCEIAPYAKSPLDGRTMLEMKAQCAAQEEVAP